MIQKTQYAHKVYFKSLTEYEQVRLTARMAGLDRNISAWIRDLVITEIRRLRPSAFMHTPEEIRSRELDLQEGSTAPPPDPGDQIVIHPDTGKPVRVKDLTGLILGTEEKTYNLDDILDDEKEIE